MKGLDKNKRNQEITSKILEILNRPWPEPIMMKDIAHEVNTSQSIAKSRVNELLLNNQVSGIRTKKVGTMTLLMKG